MSKTGSVVVMPNTVSVFMNDQMKTNTGIKNLLYADQIVRAGKNQ